MKYALFTIAALGVFPLSALLFIRSRWMRYVVWAMAAAMFAWQGTAINFLSHEEYRGSARGMEVSLLYLLSFALFLLCYRVPEHVFLAFRLPEALYRDDFTACFGFPPRDFFSTDYFPLLPWLFLFWCGFYLYDITRRDSALLSVRLPLLTVMGRYSLWVYLFHQPIIYAVLSLIFHGETR